MSSTIKMLTVIEEFIRESLAKPKEVDMEHQMLLEAYLKRLKLPAMLAHYQEIVRQTREGNQTYEGYFLALSELETHPRDENAFKRRVSQAKFPLLKTLDQFDFSAIASLNKAEVSPEA